MIPVAQGIDSTLVHCEQIVRVILGHRHVGFPSDREPALTGHELPSLSVAARGLSLAQGSQVVV
jgi:hypothetical protein